MPELKKVIIWRDGTEEQFDNDSEFLYRITTLENQGYVKSKNEGFFEDIEDGDFYISKEW